MRRLLRSDDAGITMLELMVTLSIAGVLMATAVWSLRPMLKAHRVQGTTTDVRSQLRNASERSLAEGRTYCVLFSTTAWSTYKGPCTTGTKVDGPVSAQESAISIGAAFPAPAAALPNQSTACPTAGTCAYFYPRGNALAGTVTVSNGTKAYVVNVEGLTARVSQS